MVASCTNVTQRNFSKSNFTIAIYIMQPKNKFNFTQNRFKRKFIKKTTENSSGNIFVNKDYKTNVRVSIKQIIIEIKFIITAVT